MNTDLAGSGRCEKCGQRLEGMERELQRRAELFEAVKEKSWQDYQLRRCQDRVEEGMAWVGEKPALDPPAAEKKEERSWMQDPAWVIMAVWVMAGIAVLILWLITAFSK